MGKSKIKQIILRPWAKINLYLKVLRRIESGYHEIRTFIHPIALFDDLVIRCAGTGLNINCKPENLPNRQGIPSIKDNLVTKAVHLFFKKIGEPPSVNIDLIKRIPIGGGLGGGSSDAAFALTGLNKLFEYPLSNDVLYEMCQELGMDAPFFLEPRPALCAGRGEIIEKRFNGIKFFCVLVNPGIFLSTKSVYKKFSLTLTKKKTRDNISHFAYSKNLNRIIDFIENDLEEPAIELCPEIGDILELLKRAGAVKSFVCGSGSTVCGLAGNRKEAEEVMRGVKRNGSKDWWIRMVASYI